MTTSNVKNVES